MNTVLSLAGLGVLLLVLAAFWKAAKRGMSDPKKIRAAIDDHYQSRLKKTVVPSNEYEVDFVFSSASETSVKSWRKHLSCCATRHRSNKPLLTSGSSKASQ